jgi:LysM repeat protein
MAVKKVTAKSGDTLSQIAKANGTTVAQILADNPTLAARASAGQTVLFNGTNINIKSPNTATNPYGPTLTGAGAGLGTASNPITNVATTKGVFPPNTFAETDDSTRKIENVKLADLPNFGATAQPTPPPSFTPTVQPTPAPLPTITPPTPVEIVTPPTVVDTVQQARDSVKAAQSSQRILDPIQWNALQQQLPFEERTDYNTYRMSLSAVPTTPTTPVVTTPPVVKPTVVPPVSVPTATTPAKPQYGGTPEELQSMLEKQGALQTGLAEAQADAQRRSREYQAQAELERRGGARASYYAGQAAKSQLASRGLSFSPGLGAAQRRASMAAGERQQLATERALSAQQMAIGSLLSSSVQDYLKQGQANLDTATRVTDLTNALKGTK